MAWVATKDRCRTTTHPTACGYHEHEARRAMDMLQSSVTGLSCLSNTVNPNRAAYVRKEKSPDVLGVFESPAPAGWVGRISDLERSLRAGM